MKPWYAVSSLSILTLESPDLRLTLKSPQTNVGTESDATKNEHICSMCIKINKVCKQEVGT